MIRAAKAAVGLLNMYLAQAGAENTFVCGPARAPIAKIKNRFRRQILLKGEDLDILREAAHITVAALRADGYLADDTQVHTDVEPLFMM